MNRVIDNHCLKQNFQCLPGNKVEKLKLRFFVVLLFLLNNQFAYLAGQDLKLQPL